MITWQQGQPLSEDHQYYFCKYEDFTLTLLTSPHTNMTRVEVYLEKLRIYVCEKEISPKEATEELQEYLSTLAAQFQTISQIEFWENNS
ncbi:hypothetical protein [Aulosira sp. FACHB-615]|uniref:hypothetical protein n=1 Tax=Aulosira sp. FACHB-615 TaxID=2692777 RepID=UPI001684CE8C|nr:hypothetical protein [Aulosira sp. FACHB-615]